MGREHLDAIDAFEHDPVARMPLLHEGAERERHVLGGDRRAVVKARLAPEIERDGPLVRGDLDVFGDQPVERIGLVEGPRHQRVEGVEDALGDRLVEDEGVQVHERIDVVEPERTALGRVGVDVIEMAEAGRILEVAEHRDAVADDGVGRARGRGTERGRQRQRHSPSAR
jgi:hypothetical protein